MKLAKRITNGLIGLFSIFMAAHCFNQGYVLGVIACYLLFFITSSSTGMAFHEAAHGVLYKPRWFNDLAGHVMGASIFVPLEAFRLVHVSHHAHTSLSNDFELWPYSDPKRSRPLRVAFAAFELTLGMISLPIVMAYGAFMLRRNATSKRRRKIVLGYGLTVMIWAIVLSFVHAFEVWTGFLVGFLIPAILVANVQTVRKFIEHVGLLEENVGHRSRTVYPRSSFMRKLYGWSLLNVNLHATHHARASLPGGRLPDETERLVEKGLPHVFGGYLEALRDTAPHFLNPRVGPQWEQSS